MPYIDQVARPLLDPQIERIVHDISGVGELNYVITRLALRHANRWGKPGYTEYNQAIGVLECAKLELYRTQAAPYEDKKRVKNGNVG